MLTKFNLLSYKQFVIFHSLFFCLAMAALLKLVPGIFGFTSLLILLFCQTQVFLKWRQIHNYSSDTFFQPFLGVIAWWTISLSALYYLVGLTVFVLIVWMIINFLISLLLSNKDDVKLTFFSFTKIKDFINNLDWSDVFVLAGATYIVSNLAYNLILDGSPSPWVNTHWSLFFVFALINFCLLFKIKKDHRNSVILSCAMLFVSLTVIALKYILSFGYDTLLHQAALNYIVQQGRIEPLTPFYIGQYVWEILFHQVSGLSFNLLERWLTPLTFIGVIIISARALVEHFKWSRNFIILAPFAFLFILPWFATYTSPFALALAFVLLSFIYLYLYLHSKENKYYEIAVYAGLIAFFIHPFAGLNILIAIILSKRFTSLVSTKIGQVVMLFFYVAVAVPVAFLFYNWISGQTIYLKNPFFFKDDFLAIFGSPVWYSMTHFSWGLKILYIWEKINFFVVLGLAGFWLLRSRRYIKTDIFIIAFILGTLVAAWLFISAIDVSGYSYGDFVNYSYRLVGMVKVLAWPFVFLLVANFINNILKRKNFLFVVIIIGLAALSSINWYFTYPRNDDISRLNVNNVRAIDYEAVDFIYHQENGKTGYIVLANQLFGAAAIERYGFEPYYSSKWGNVFYYSVPMSGRLNQIYEELMNAEELDEYVFLDIMVETKTKRIYFVLADYWPLKPEIYAQFAAVASGHKIMNNGALDIFWFDRNAFGDLRFD